MRFSLANLKSTIQDLYELQSLTHGYLGPETQSVLVSKVHALVSSLSNLSHSASSLNTLVPPEIIAYIEEGRNPDIYTREFVELVQRGNVFLKGKSEAWGEFAQVLGEELEEAGIGGGQNGIGKEGATEGNMQLTEPVKEEATVKKEEG